MRLYLIQHGIPLPESEDPQKGLSNKGVVQTQKTAEFLRRQDTKIDLIWHSKKLRAVQTAQIFSQHITAAEIVERDDMNPQDSVDKFARELETADKDAMIVGHLPFLQKLTAKLLVKSANIKLISFKNSGVLCLEHKENWKVLWMVTPDLFL